MLPVIVSRRIASAKAVAEISRTVASECAATPGISERLIQNAQTIDELVALLESATWVAKLNHDTILGRAT